VLAKSCAVEIQASLPAARFKLNQMHQRFGNLARSKVGLDGMPHRNHCLVS
jgi:hypothetical protein